MQATMIKIERNAKMEAAINRCKSVHPKVRRIDNNTVAVAGRNADYTVRFATPRAGLLLAQCNCEAGRKGQLCYHIPAAFSAPLAAPTRKTDEKAVLVAKVLARWSGKYSQMAIAEGLVKRFGVNSLENVHISYLRQLAKAA